jgi:NAD-dependent protein deacetylase/lipoamidase
MAVRCAADIIRSGQRGVVLTGAGVSTPSGIPDFRSTTTGLWEKYDPFEVASLSAFRYNPVRFYEWMRTLATEIHDAGPNPAHFGLAKLEEAGYIQTVITQNIDQLHQRAGSRNVLEVHGSMGTLSCTGCYRTVSSKGYLEAYLQSGEIPYCPNCHSILKPDLVLMGEQLPAKTWLKAQEACKKCDLMIVAGSSLEVLPVAGLPMRALENGAHLILINHTTTYLDVRADVVLHEDVAVIIPAIVAELSKT